MKILYVILTCRKYAETRQQWQRDTWLKGVDYVYLDDTYHDRFADRYLAFFAAYNGNHDWLFFCDDDTFVFPERMKEFLTWYDAGLPMQIGFVLSDFFIYDTGIKTTLCSGGAGIAISRELVRHIETYLYETEIPITTPESDTNLAVWAKMGCGEFGTVSANKAFCPTNPRHHNVRQDCITYHYCEEVDFKILNDRL